MDKSLWTEDGSGFYVAMLRVSAAVLREQNRCRTIRMLTQLEKQSLGGEMLNVPLQDARQGTKLGSFLSGTSTAVGSLKQS